MYRQARRQAGRARVEHNWNCFCRIVTRFLCYEFPLRHPRNRGRCSGCAVRHGRARSAAHPALAGRWQTPLHRRTLPDESCYQSAKVLRALLAGIEALEKATERKSRKLPAGAGKPWDTEEDRALVADFEGGAAIADLAQNHQRTEGAIRSRLMKLGKLQPPGGGV